LIQNREIPLFGSPEVRRVRVRLIAATNRDLRAEVLGGRFREDLYNRLSSIQIRIPSLPGRLEDIPVLVQYFLKKYNHAYGKNIAALTRRTQAVMLQHAWPGNVRELENVISRASITATGGFIDVADYRSSCSIAERWREGATTGDRCRWTRCGGSTFKECWGCAKGTGYRRRRCWRLGERVCTGI
jgi:DNA-binding NtrC family response regulator